LKDIDIASAVQMG